MRECAKGAIVDWTLLKHRLILTADRRFVLARPLHLEPDHHAMGGAALLMLLVASNIITRSNRQRTAFGDVEWITISSRGPVHRHGVESGGLLQAFCHRW